MSGVCRDIGRERRSRASLVEITLGRERRSRASLVENRLSARLSEGESQRSALSAQRLAGFTKHLLGVGSSRPNHQCHDGASVGSDVALLWHVCFVVVKARGKFRRKLVSFVFGLCFVNQA